MSRPRISAALRDIVHARAGGRCEYCRIPEAACFATLEIDHIVAEQHGGLTESGNLALSCLPCNKRKGPNLASIDPQSGALSPLFHPRVQVWDEHFQLTLDGQIIGHSAIGRATVRVLVLNDKPRLEERRLLIAAGAWT